ncbi:MAG: hypothetical protein H6971_03870 [Gammaproteobacteria bacterium]|nr:hypothetical protein [Gammaproteobacteria bacterium]
MTTHFELPPGSVQRLAEKLNSLPPSPRLSHGKRVILEGLMGPLLQAVEVLGYTVPELVKVLAGEGIVIHVTTLRRYLKKAREVQGTPSQKGDPPPKAGSLARSTQPPVQTSARTAVNRTPGTFTPKAEIPLEELLRRAREEEAGGTDC